jgi:hypothetical protein
MPHARSTKDVTIRELAEASMHSTAIVVRSTTAVVPRRNGMGAKQITVDHRVTAVANKWGARRCRSSLKPNEV